MNKKSYLWSLLTMIMVAMLSVGFVSCSSDDDDEADGGLGLSESQIRNYLESGSGTWLVTIGHDEFEMVFRDGKTNGIMYGYGRFEPYSVKGNLVYIDCKRDDSLDDVFEGGIRLTKLTSKKIAFYWANNRSEKYTGTKLEDYYY